MPTTKQRREAARRHLEKQLQRRQEREAARRKFTLIASIVGTILAIGAVVVAVTFLGSGNPKAKPAAKSTNTQPVSPSATPSPSPSPSPSTSARPAKGPSVSFDGVTVGGATDLGGAPQVTSKSASTPTKLAVKDLVAGKGKAATPSSTVTVQYSGVLYKTGKAFDSSWSRGQAATFALTGVVKGFTQGIGGTTGIGPMKVGGRRIIIMPSALGYGAQANGSIPANSPLVFVVDLKSIGA